MARAIWTGTIGFGLVSVPVRLYPATKRKDIRFHEIDRLSGQRIRHQKIVETPSLETPQMLASHGRTSQSLASHGRAAHEGRSPGGSLGPPGPPTREREIFEIPT